MSREIKFRAWLKPRWEDDEDAGKMYYDIQNSYDMMGNVKPYDPMTDFASWFEDGVAIVEQYTGLKDKKGKEIYEGDIVANGTLTGVVEYKVADFCAWTVGTTTNGIVLLSGSWTVIGNIHENGELVGGEE